MATLTVGIPTHSDHVGLYFTLLFFCRAIYNLGLQDRVKLLVVNNKPAYSHEGCRKMVEDDFGGRYVALAEPESTGAPRDLLVREAETEWLLIVDSHVILESEEQLKRTVEWCEGNRSDDLFYGVCMSSKLVDAKTGKRRAIWTHWIPQHGRDGLFGTSAVAQPLVDDPEHKPQQILHSGCGLFMVRKEAYLGFHPEQVGFGAEGWLPLRYMEERRRVFVLPFQRFFHCFRPKDVKIAFDTRHVTIARNQLLYVRDLKPNPFLTYNNVKRNLQTKERIQPERWGSVLESVGRTEEWFLNRSLPERLLFDLSKPGPGTEFYGVLKEVRINPAANCDCKARMAQMNAWGSAVCSQPDNFALIVRWIEESKERWGWLPYLQAGALALMTGLAFNVSWTDPVPDLVREAISRARAKGA